MMKTTIEELRTFIAIVDFGSIYKAAEYQEQTSSAVSRTLKRLEEKLNVTLLERTTRHQKLTNNGAIFLQYAREVTQKLQEAEDRLLQTNNDLSGRIRIDSATPLVLHILTPLVIEFLELYPNIDIEITNHDHVIDLLKENVDIAIRIGNLKDSTLHSRRLASTPSYLVASPNYLKKRGHIRFVEELEHHKTIGFSELESLNIVPYEKESQENYYLLKPSIRASSGETVRSFALADAGIAYLSSFLINDDIKKGRLIQLVPENLLPKVQDIHAVYYYQGYIPKRISLFLDFLQKRLQNNRTI